MTDTCDEALASAKTAAPSIPLDSPAAFFNRELSWLAFARRVESIMPVTDPKIRAELAAILDVNDADNATRWDCAPDGSYRRRRPGDGEERRAAQEVFIARAEAEGKAAPPAGKLRSRARKN